MCDCGIPDSFTPRQMLNYILIFRLGLGFKFGIIMIGGNLQENVELLSYYFDLNYEAKL